MITSYVDDTRAALSSSESQATQTALKLFATTTSSRAVCVVTLTALPQTPSWPVTGLGRRAAFGATLARGLACRITLLRFHLPSVRSCVDARRLRELREYTTC